MMDEAEGEDLVHCSIGSKLVCIHHESLRGHIVGGRTCQWQSDPVPVFLEFPSILRENLMGINCGIVFCFCFF